MGKNRQRIESAVSEGRKDAAELEPYSAKKSDANRFCPWLRGEMRGGWMKGWHDEFNKR